MQFEMTMNFSPLNICINSKLIFQKDECEVKFYSYLRL